MLSSKWLGEKKGLKEQGVKSNLSSDYLLLLTTEWRVGECGKRAGTGWMD